MYDQVRSSGLRRDDLKNVFKWCNSIKKGKQLILLGCLFKLLYFLKDFFRKKITSGWIALFLKMLDDKEICKQET